MEKQRRLRTWLFNIIDSGKVNYIIIFFRKIILFVHLKGFNKYLINEFV